MTRREAYDYGVEQLEAEGIENADCDIRILLEDLCGVDREELFIQGDKVISRRESEIFMNAVNRRMGHYPVQYITGKQEFMGLTFSVNQNVLIPRMDTEILVEEVLKELMDGSRILDMCTGSGCILLSLLYYSNDCEGVGVDISQEALDVAKDNSGRLILDDTFDLLFQTGGKGKKHLDEEKNENGIYIVKDFAIGNVHYDDMELSDVRDCVCASTSGHFIATNNMLGYPCFKDHIIQLDFKNNVFRIK